MENETDIKLERQKYKTRNPKMKRKFGTMKNNYRIEDFFKTKTEYREDRMMENVKREIETEDLNSVYKTLRYFIHFDGKIQNYIMNQEDPYIRGSRIMYIEFQRDPEKMKLIEEFVNG